MHIVNHNESAPVGDLSIPVDLSGAKDVKNFGDREITVNGVEYAKCKAVYRNGCIQFASGALVIIVR